MINILLTQDTIEREAVHVLHNFCCMPWNKSREVSVIPKHDISTNTEYLNIKLDNYHTSLNIISADLIMSLDDFSDLRLKPALVRLAERVGYATWD